METIERFDLRVADKDPEYRQIVDSEGRHGPLTVGRLIEGQFRCPAGYVLLLTENAPYDEGLHILLLNEGYKILDCMEIGRSLTPGILKNPRPEGDGLGFEMFDCHWHLKVHTTGQYWPSLRPPPGAGRPWKRILAPRYLALESAPAD